MLLNILPTLTKFPGSGELKKWDDSWANTLKFWDSSGENASGIASTSDKVIEFYISNQPYLQADSAILVQMAGFIQNTLYSGLYALAEVSSGLIKAALAPLYYLPQMLMDPNNPFHILYYICVSIGVLFVTLSVLMSIPKLSKQQGGLSTGVGNALFTVGMMFVLPFIIASASDFTQKTASEVLGSGTTSLAAAPMIDNTVDVEKWALSGFNKEPFSKDAPLYNSLGKADRPIPDFASTVDKDDVELLNKIAKSKQNVSSDGIPIKEIGNVFQFSPKISPQNDKSDKPQYSLEKLSMEKGITHINDKQYKRYRVQNMPAILSYAVVIVVGALFAIKIMRATISVYTNLIGSAVAASRDAAKSTEPIKNSIMETLNSFIAIFLDIFLLFLFTYFSSSLPKQIASNYSGLMHGLVYAMVMGILAISTYNGSSAIERQFGMTSGARGQGGIMRSMAMPGAFLGSMTGGMMADKMRQKRNEKALEGAKDKPDKSGKDDPSKPIVNNGEKQADLLDAPDTQESNTNQTNQENDATNASSSSNAPSNENQNSVVQSSESSDSSTEQDNMNAQGGGTNPGDSAADGLDDQPQNGDSGSDDGKTDDPDLDSLEENGPETDDFGGESTQGFDDPENAGEDAADALDDDDETDTSITNDGETAASTLDDDGDSYGDSSDNPTNNGENTLDQIDSNADADGESDDDKPDYNPGQDVDGLDDPSDETETQSGSSDMGEDSAVKLDNDYSEGAQTGYNTTPDFTETGQSGDNSDSGGYGQLPPDVQERLDEQEKQHKQNEFDMQQQNRKQYRKQKNRQRLEQAIRDIDQAEDPNKPTQ